MKLAPSLAFVAFVLAVPFGFAARASNADAGARAPNAVAGCPSPTITAPTLAGERWLVETRISGGIMGRHTVAVVRSDGAAWIDDCAFALANADRDDIAALLDATNEAAWAPSYRRRGDECCDLIYESVRVVRARADGVPSDRAAATSSLSAGSVPSDYRALFARVGAATARYNRFYGAGRVAPTPTPMPTSTSTST